MQVGRGGDGRAEITGVTLFLSSIEGEVSWPFDTAIFALERHLRRVWDPWWAGSGLGLLELQVRWHQPDRVLTRRSTASKLLVTVGADPALTWPPHDPVGLAWQVWSQALTAAADRVGLPVPEITPVEELRAAVDLHMERALAGHEACREVFEQVRDRFSRRVQKLLASVFEEFPPEDTSGPLRYHAWLAGVELTAEQEAVLEGGEEEDYWPPGWLSYPAGVEA